MTPTPPNAVPDFAREAAKRISNALYLEGAVGYESPAIDEPEAEAIIQSAIDKAIARYRAERDAELRALGEKVIKFTTATSEMSMRALDSRDADIATLKSQLAEREAELTQRDRELQIQTDTTNGWFARASRAETELASVRHHAAEEKQRLSEVLDQEQEALAKCKAELSGLAESQRTTMAFLSDAEDELRRLQAKLAAQSAALASLIKAGDQLAAVSTERRRLIWTEAKAQIEALAGGKEPKAP